MSEREGEVEALALAVHDALRCNCDSGDGDRMIAEELHASLWLRAHDDRIRAEALRDLADMLEAEHSDLPDVMGVARWIRANDPAALRVAAGIPTHHTTEEATP